MSRTSIAEVKEILDTSLSDSIIEGFISGANESITATVGSDSSISSDLKKELERWLSAHFLASTREQQLSDAKAGPAQATYQGKTGMQLDSTFYGQTVKVMDPTGKLSGKRASIYAVKGA